MKFSQNLFTLKHFFLLIKIIILLLLSTVSFANEKKIGSVTELNGTIVVINETLEERDLLIHDPIFLNEEIFVTEGSSATIQFEDNTAIIMKELTSLNVNEFENSKKNPKIKAKLLKGKITIESGSIAKNSNGEMLVDILTSSLGLRGTRVEINLKSDGKSDISLAEDSFGNVGELEVSSAGQTSNITSPDQVIEVSETSEIVSREKTNQEKENEKTVSEILIKSSKIDETEIEKQLQKKLDDGKLQDANNDGIIDDTDIQLVKDEIANEKKQKIDFIVENSKDENTEFLSDVINQSDEKNTGEVIEKIIDTQDNLVEGVVENLSDKDNKFLTTTTSEGAGLIKEKIFETIVLKETEKSAEILSKVMAKADTTTINSVINNITEKNTNTESKLSLKVMAEFSEKNPEKLETLSQTNSDQIDKLTVSAVDKASTSNEDAELIAKVVASASEELVNKVVEEVSKNSTDENQTLSAKVLKAIVDTEPNKLEIINDDVKDIMIKQTIESAQNQQEGSVNEETEDITSIVSDIIVNTDTETGSKMIEELNNSASDSNLSLQVISDISEKDTGKLNTLSENNKEQIEKLTETAIKNADATEESADLIAKVVASASDELVNKVVEEVSKNSTDENQTLSAQVLKAIVDSDSGKIDIINDDVKDIMIKQTIESAQNQQEGTGIQQDQDMTSIVSDIIVNTDTETGSKMIEELNNSASDSDLSLQVISGISEKDTEKLNTLSENNKEQIETLTETAIKNADATEESAELIALVVANASEELVNKVVEEVSKNSTDENQTLSAQVLKAIVDTEPNKLEIINDDIKETMITQTIESAQNQQEGTGIQQDQDMTSIVSDIIVNTDTETGSKIIEELNNSASDSDLSLQVISGISEKDTEKLNTLAENNKEQIDTLTETAVKNAGSSQENAELIALVVANASDEFANQIIGEVTKNSTDENQALSAKVMKSIVETNPDKVENLSDENKETMINQTIEAAKNQAEGSSEDEIDLSNTIAEIVTNSDTGTAAKVLESLEEFSEDSDSKLSLNVVSNLTKQENYEEKMEILSVTSSIVEQSINTLVEKAIENASSEEDLDLVSDIVENSKGTIADKIINSANKNEASKKKITEVIVKVVEKNPEKAVEIIEKNKNTNTVLETVKTKIEKGEAVSADDFEDVFESNVSPN